MSEAKPVGSTLPANYRVSSKQSPKTKVEKEDMMKIPCLHCRGFDLRNGVYTIGYWICGRSGESVHEQSGKRTLGRRLVDIPVPKRHLKPVPLI